MAFEPETLTLDALRAAPAPDFIDRDADVIKAKLVAKFEQLTGRTLYPAQTEMFVIELMTYAKALMGEAIQTAFLQNRAVWAEGSHLDDLGANFSTFRLAAQSARSTVRFTMAQTRETSVSIPKGTRVAAGSELIFRTVAAVLIPAGDLTVDVEVVAVASGAIYNNLQIGQIEDILDPVPFVSSVANVQISGGGSDVEGDDRFRLRIVNALERVSNAGPRQGYVENVKAVNPAIIDVAVIRPQPGHIHITPLMNDGVSSDPVDVTILDYLDAETIVPMGDYISIVKATEVQFDVVMELKIVPGTGTDIVANAEAAIRARFADWSNTLGAQIAPSALVEAVRKVTGVVGVTGPVFDFTDLPATSFATIDQLTVTLVEVANV